METMRQLKDQVSDANTRVDQCEGLVSRLENEMIEWDANKKLLNRDRELADIEGRVQDFLSELSAERQAMESTQKQQADIQAQATEQKAKEDATYLINGIQQYVQDIDHLLTEAQGIVQERA